jgi:hypothetical protein
MPERTVVSKYRGYTIYKTPDGAYTIDPDMVYPMFNTAWGAIEYIDELLSP